MSISLNDYQEGFIGGQNEGAEELLKAMQAGQITGRETANLSLSQEPLKAESLEKTLKLLEYRQQDIKLLNAIPKMTAFNTVEEFLQLESYGDQKGGFYNEGELSDVADSKYIRRAELVKYIQITGEVTMQAQMVRSYVDAMRKEVENKVMWVQRKANQALTKANSSIVPQEWNGLYAQHASIGSGSGFLYANLEEYMGSDVVVDLRGKSLKQIDVEKAAVTVDQHFGTATHLVSNTPVISALAQDFFSEQRIMMDGNGFNGVIGTAPKAIDTSMGRINLMGDKSIAAEKARLLTDGATSTKAPANVTVNNAPDPNADSLSKVQSGEIGNVYYAVASKNSFGESALVVQSNTAVALVVGESIDLDFSAGSGSYAATGFVIYRTKVTSAGSPAGLKFFPIFEISVTQKAVGYDGVASGLVRDRSRTLPDTETAFLTQMDEEVLSFKQLAPISKLDLAVLSMSRRFIVFLFGTPNLYAPKKMVKFINCGKTLN